MLREARPLYLFFGEFQSPGGRALIHIEGCILIATIQRVVSPVASVVESPAVEMRDADHGHIKADPQTNSPGVTATITGIGSSSSANR